jgi:hypothetical protein
VSRSDFTVKHAKSAETGENDREITERKGEAG